MTIKVTLTDIGADAGPFDLYSNVDGFISAFATGITAQQLLDGYPCDTIANTTVIRVRSVNSKCNNYSDISTFSANYKYATSVNDICNGGGINFNYPLEITCNTSTLTNESGVLTNLPDTIHVGFIENSNYVTFIRIPSGLSGIEYHRITNCISCQQ